MLPQKKYLVAGIILCLFAVSCGVKEWPSVPKQVLPEPVKLSIETSGNNVELSWTVSSGSSVPVAGIRVFRASVPVFDDCKNCPVIFSKVADIPFTKETMTYSDKLEKGYRYKYKVICYTEKGVSGKDSNIVEAVSK